MSTLQKLVQREQSTPFADHVRPHILPSLHQDYNQAQRLSIYGEMS